MPHETPRHAHSASLPGDAGGVRDLGADIIAAVDGEAIARRLAQLPTAALLAELEAVIEAIDHATPASSRRRVGWWGRLLGRDLLAQAQPDPLPNRLRLRLDAAQRQADELAEQAAALEPLSTHLQEQISRLGQCIADARSATTGPATQRRLSHLEAIAASWRTTAAQVALVRAHAVHLLDRHAQVRDLLRSLWQGCNTAQAARSVISSPRVTALQDALRELHASAPSFSAPAADTDRPTQEPSP